MQKEIMNSHVRAVTEFFHHIHVRSTSKVYYNRSEQVTMGASIEGCKAFLGGGHEAK